MATEIERYTFYSATAKFRRGEGWNVKPEAEPLDGQRMLVMVGWEIEPDDSSLYAGEFAMIIEDRWDDEIGWIASGDLTDIEHVPFDEGMALKKATREEHARGHSGGGSPAGNATRS